MSKVTKKKYKKKKLWGADVEELLCEMWEQRISDMRGSRKNTHIFSEMSAELEQAGAHFTPSEIHVKINNLTAKYKKEKSQIDCSGGSPPDWPLFFKVHAILGKLKGSNAELLAEDSALEEFFLEEHLDELSVDQSLTNNDNSNGNNNSNEGQPPSSSVVLPKRKHNANCNVKNGYVKKFKSRNDLEMDSDYNFLLSVMPQMKKMSLENNFQFRIDIMQMLMKINQKEKIATQSRAQDPTDQDETSEAESTFPISEIEIDIKKYDDDYSAQELRHRHSENSERNLNKFQNKITQFISVHPKSTQRTSTYENGQEGISAPVSIGLDDDIIPKIEPNF